MIIVFYRHLGTIRKMVACYTGLLNQEYNNPTYCYTNITLMYNRPREKISTPASIITKICSKTGEREREAYIYSGDAQTRVGVATV